MWRGVRRVAIQTAPVQWFAVAVEGAIVRRAPPPGAAHIYGIFGGRKNSI